MKMYQDSSDKKVATAGILVKTGRKWKAQEPIDRADSRLQHNILVGNMAVGQAGLDSYVFAMTKTDEERNVKWYRT